MLIKFLKTLSVLTIILVLAPAIAKQDKNAGAATDNEPAAKTTATAPAGATGNSMHAADTESSIMDKPVNFSTPEDVDKSIEAVRQQAGENAARKLEGALAYILFYDLSIGHNKEKMYARYNGKTPNEIIAQMRR